MDGLLIIDKPEGITSHDVVARVRRVLRTKRVGHTGTLDPFATGVMVVLVGKATRLAQFVDKDAKEYVATVQFGFETDTGDKTGNPTTQTGLQAEDIAEKLRQTDLKGVLSEFCGDIEQTPPMYSAKKVEGKKLYELARQGIEIPRQAINVTIFELVSLPPEIRDPRSAIRIRILCSAGTYIRTLAEDIGRRIGMGAHLTELRRTASGKFTISGSITLNELEAIADPASALRPVREAVEILPVFELAEDRIDKTRNGMSTRDLSGRFKDGENVQMVDSTGELISVGYFDGSEQAVQPKVVLV